jgi:predicted Zn-dependent protease
MRRPLIALLFLFLVTPTIYFGCRSAPVTERKQLLLVPEDQEVSMGVTAYHDLMGQETPSANPQFVDMVNRVGHRIAAVAGRDDYQWEFRVIQSDQQNAFALPGGKVAVYEGILPVCANEAGLAVVMSHEIAHALALHGGERMSHEMVAKGVQNTLQRLTKSQEQINQERIMMAYGVASKYGVILPYSRKQEAEADHIGLMLMAKAGYDPREAPAFWERFSRVGGEKPPEFLSTHPSDATRAETLRKLLPQAEGLYAQAPMKYGFGAAVPLAVNRLPAAQPVSSSAPQAGLRN